jgi:hypothetical protein
MSVIATAKRRRRQAKNGYKHLAKLGRPVYKKVSASKALRRLMRVIEKQKMIAQRKGSKSK